MFINEKDCCDMLIKKLDNEIPKEYPYNYFNIFFDLTARVNFNNY